MLTKIISTAALTLAAGAALAEDYVDGTQWDLNRTATRADNMDYGGQVGDVTAPGYNPNVLRPAGDGLGRHRATEPLKMDGHSIKNLPLPTGGDEAANKDYVDALVDQINDTIAALPDPAATPDLEEVLTEGNDGGGNKITGIEDPTSGMDAANKRYVDKAIADALDGLGIGGGSDPAPAPFVNVRTAQFGVAAPNDNLFFYRCAESSVQPNGTLACDRFETVNPAAPADLKFKVNQSNISIAYSFSAEVTAGECVLKDEIGEGEVAFGGGYFPPTAEPGEWVSIGAALSRNWGGPEEVSGPNSLSYGCSIKWRVRMTSPDRPGWTRTAATTIGDMRVSVPIFPVN